MMLLVVRRNKELKWSNNKISTGRYSFGLKEGRKEGRNHTVPGGDNNE